MFKAAVFFILISTIRAFAISEEVWDGASEVTVMGKLRCRLKTQFCAGIFFRQEGVPFPEILGKVQTRCTHDRLLTQKVTFIPNYQVVNLDFQFSIVIFHNCTTDDHGFWYYHPFPMFGIYEEEPPFLYDLELTERQNVGDFKRKFLVDKFEVDPGVDVIEEFKMRQASGTIMEDDGQFIDFKVKD